jgi:predicted dehydrogenase
MAATKKLGFAVVGLGKIAEEAVLPAFRHTKNAKLVAVVSRDAAKAKRVARKFGAKSYYQSDDFSSCLLNPGVDAIYIATPPGNHLKVTHAAVAAGKHILCEKPLAATTTQSAEMVAVCKRAGVTLMTAYRKYFEPSSLALKKLIASGKLGKLDAIHTSFSENYRPGLSQPWLVDLELSGGGPLMDLGIYCINSGRWLAGDDPIEVDAESWRRDDTTFHHVEEGISFRAKFPGGLLLHGNSTFSAELSSFIYVQGTEGWAMLTPAFTFHEPRLLSWSMKGKITTRKFPVLDEFALEIDAFATAIQRRKTPEPDGQQGHRDVIIASAIYESARQGHPVHIDYGS